MKGIILAGGKGTRLYPLTLGVSKQLLPVFDKPMIYYPLSMLMLAGIRDILIITTPEDQFLYQRLLRDGSQWGLKFSYTIQAEPRGLADAFLIGEAFIQGEPVALILGDNIFYGHGLPAILRDAATTQSGAVIFAYRVKNPENYGVVKFTVDGKATYLEEKPKSSVSDYAIPGFYFYDGNVTDYARELKPSARGEIEITDLNRIYMEQGALHVVELGRGVAWLDAGQHDSLLQASNYVQAVEDRQGLMISCPEEIAYRMNFIDIRQLRRLAAQFNGNRYGEYLSKLAEQG